MIFYSYTGVIFLFSVQLPFIARNVWKYRKLNAIFNVYLTSIPYNANCSWWKLSRLQRLVEIHGETFAVVSFV